VRFDEEDFAHDPLQDMSDSLLVVHGSDLCRNRLATFSRSDGTDVVLVSGLTTFALSLGFVYVEVRYVRYDGLSYLLGTSVLVVLAADLTVNQFRLLSQFGGSQFIKAAIGVIRSATLSISRGRQAFSTMTGCRCET
jgi:hypothetical protein